MIEQRAARRYELSLPVIVRAAISGTGRTRNISVRGVYFTFTIDKDLSAGAELDLTMVLPAEVTGGAEVFVKTTGKVVRVDKRSGNGDRTVDVAAAFKMYEIVRNKAVVA